LSAAVIYASLRGRGTSLPRLRGKAPRRRVIARHAARGGWK